MKSENLFVIIVLLCVCTGCHAQDVKVETGTASDCQEEHDFIENIYQWEIAYGSIGNGTEAAYHPYDDGYDADRIDEFIKNYLEEQGIRKTDPDGIVYNRRGEPFVEYYIEESEKKYCFVVHLWGNYWIDYETGVSAYQDAVYCTTHTVQETDWTGTLIYNIDEENNSTRERLYDTEGLYQADVFYINKPQEPFLSVTDYWYLDSGFDAGNSVLCRGQKFCFSEMQMETDAEGRIIRYNGSHEFPKDQKPWAEGEFMLDAYFSEPCTFVYDESGRLIRIEEELMEEEGRENSGQIEYQYDRNGMLEEANYCRSSRTQGTTDSSGRIEYDEQGRMICNEYYITHGGHTDIFLYEGDAQRPWACLNWCSFAPGFTKVSLFLEQ